MPSRPLSALRQLRQERRAPMPTNAPPFSPMTKVSPTPAERMRLHRKRRRHGLQYVRILLHVTDIDGLIRLGLLRDAQRTDALALQSAVLGLVYRETERDV